MPQSITMTPRLVEILAYLLEHKNEEVYGYDLFRAVDIGTGTGYGILHKLEKLGWLSSSWVQPNQHSDEKRPRRYYRLTKKGIKESTKAFQDWSIETKSVLDKVMSLIKTAT